MTTRTDFADATSWFVTLPEKRQEILRDDKWMLAEAAFRAGRESALASKAEASADPGTSPDGDVPSALAAILELWPDAFLAYNGAFDTAIARRRQSDEYAVDARKRVAEFNGKLDAFLRERNLVSDNRGLPSLRGMPHPSESIGWGWIALRPSGRTGFAFDIRLSGT